MVGVPHGISICRSELFCAHRRRPRRSRPRPAFLPDLIDGLLTRQFDPGRVFDLTLPLYRAAEAYAAMDERRAIKSLLRP